MVCPLADGTSTIYHLHDAHVCQPHGTIEECHIIGAEHVQRVVDCFYDKYHDIHTINAFSLLSHIFFLEMQRRVTSNFEIWLGRIFSYQV